MPKRVIIKETVRGVDFDAGAYLREVEAWTHGVVTAADQAAGRFTKGKRRRTRTYKSGRWQGTTEKKLKGGTRVRIVTDGGEPEKVQFLLPVHGIFREYGVGRGRLIRTPDDWFSRQLQARQEKLADTVASHTADKLMSVKGLSRKLYQTT